LLHYLPHLKPLNLPHHLRLGKLPEMPLHLPQNLLQLLLRHLLLGLLRHLLLVELPD
jgi:hypothetical protein